MSQATLAKIVADFETSLATAMAVGATSVTIQNATDDDGVALPTGRYFLTIDGNNSSKEHISCTLTSTNLTDIKTLSRQGTETSGCLRAHRVGAKVVLTDFAHIKKINDLLDGTTLFDPSVVLAYSGTASVTTAHQLATKDYVDSGVLQGAADASTTVKGIAFMSTGPASATGPIAVGSNDARLPTQDENDALAGTSGTPSSTNKFVTADDVSSAGATGKVVRADATGKIGSSMLVGALPAVSGAALTGITDTQIADLNGYMSSASFTLTATSTTGLTGVLTGPTGWRMAVVHISASGNPQSITDKGSSIYATGATSAGKLDQSINSNVSWDVSFSGATGTLSISSTTQNSAWSGGGTLYFYR